MRRMYSSMRCSSTKSCSSSAKRTYSQSSLNFTRNLKVLSSSKMSGEKVHFFTELALHLRELVGLAGQFVNQFHTGLGGLHGLRVFGTEYILMRFIPVVCRNLAVSLQVLFAVPLHFLPLLPILCSEGLFFLVGRMFPLSAFPVPIGADVFVHRASRCHPGIRSIKSRLSFWYSMTRVAFSLMKESSFSSWASWLAMSCRRSVSAPCE